jgi:cytochrome c oxidase subunit 2
MIGIVTAMEPGEYQLWLSGGTNEPPAVVGERLFSSLACNTCHTADGKGRGPKLAELYGKQVKLNNGTSVTFDDTYIRESILDPAAKVVENYQVIMPSFRGQVSEEQIAQIIAYLKSIGPKDSGTAAAAPAAAKPAAPAKQ